MMRIMTDINLIAAILCIATSIMCFAKNLGLMISVFCILVAVLNFVMFVTKKNTREMDETIDEIIKEIEL